MSTQTYNVTGMSCGHCEKAVFDEVAKLPGVSDIHVSAEKKSLSFSVEEEITDAEVIAAVDEAGYDAVRA